MKLVVDVPEGNYKALKKMSGCGLGVYHEMILNGTPLSEEFEKIKSEIIEYRSKQNCSCSDCLDIIDNHLSELKGDNNAES